MAAEAPAAAVLLQEWIQTRGRDVPSNGLLVRELALEMRHSGIPVDRMLIATILIHPQASAWIYKWESSSDTTTTTTTDNQQVVQVPIRRETYDRRYELGGYDAPMHQLERGTDPLRIRASDEYIPENCRDQFTDRGYLDMYGRRLEFRGDFVGGVTWNTKSPDGWTPEHVQTFDAILPALTCVVMLHLKEACMQSLLCTYLGKDPGNKVFQGSIERGQGRTVRSVIWFSDIRGFTRLSGQLPRDVLIALINDVFEVTEKALSNRGGDVLKYMGDGVMGVFTAEGEEFEEDRKCGLCDERCSAGFSQVKADLFRNAREAAAELQTSLCQLRQDRASRGLPGADLQMGVGLHYGDVSYGNIGAPGRLDFTVIGPSVNLASRVESLCGELGASVLATDEFVKRDEEVDAWKSRGKHVVKGVSDAVEVFELLLGEQ